jgi:hypothetical protein
MTVDIRVTEGLFFYTYPKAWLIVVGESNITKGFGAEGNNSFRVLATLRV